MNLSLYQIDAFTDRPFYGNPAAVVPLDSWLEDHVLQAIALENNLSETAFFVRGSDRYHLRWFTPTVEVDLCGHATLASAYAIWSQLGEGSEELLFQTRSGILTVRRNGDLVEMTFPNYPPRPCEAPAALLQGLRREPLEVLHYHECGSGNYLAVYASEEEILQLAPDFAPLATFERTGVIVTAPGTASDFSSRYFAPSFGVPEDPVTGSIHCCLTPYWSGRLGKRELHARQVSARGGDLYCRQLENSVIVAGKAVLYLKGSIEIS